ncbi:NAD(P)/FAD-dependent oxidoreductase [Nostoc sp. UIC 10607]|uniref:Halogenase n=2 Tax=Nostoc TaxID=1177 RepID=A0ABR8IJ38_9NOSO|nr:MULTISPECIES: hypothetical protein [Nostoc]MBD2565983.1 hypothetical protein [Nostoc linckia FACHB-391]MBD2651594.1 hypothetical protein [Nostoc foliaceum FACHB-393]
MSQSEVCSLTMNPVAVVGDSLSAYAVVAALARLGYRCDLLCDPAKSHFYGPSLVLNDVSETLLRELFPDVNLGVYSQRLTHRWVHWGTQPVQVEQPALAIRSHSLLQLLRNSKVMQHTRVIDVSQLTAQQISQKYAWTVYTRHKRGALALPKSSQFLVGGQRVMIAAEIQDTSKSAHVCYIESLADAWLFYAPVDGGAMLQACLPITPANPRRALLECLYQSTTISAFINDLQKVDCFSSAPHLQWPLYGSGWLMVGESAIKIDPVSGEGTPFALRSAILAGAVIDAILSDRIPDISALNHYKTRLTHSFISHLRGCIQFYREVFSTNLAWQAEINQMIDIAETLSTQLEQQAVNVLNYRLIDFELHIG